MGKLFFNSNKVIKNVSVWKSQSILRTNFWDPLPPPPSTPGYCKVSKKNVGIAFYSYVCWWIPPAGRRVGQAERDAALHHICQSHPSNK